MRILNSRYVSKLPRAGMLVPLLIAVFWIVGFYTPKIAPYFYASRWSASIIIGVLAIIVIFRKGRIKLDNINFVLLLFIFVLLASFSYSFVPVYTILRSLSAILLLVSAYILSISLVNNEDDIKRIFYAFVSLYLALSVVFFTSTALDSYAFASDRLQANEYFKATGGGTMIVSAVLILFWLQRFCSRRYKVIVWALIVALAISLIATKSRAPIAGALLLWPIGWVIISGRKFSRGIVFFLVVCGVFASILYLNPEAKKYLRVDEQEIASKGYDISTGRFQRWEFLLHDADKEPVLGYGFGTSRYARWRYFAGENATLEWSTAINTALDQKLAHNQHVQLFYELGAVGLFLFWAFCFLLLKMGMSVLSLPNSHVSLMLKMVFLSICFHLIDTFSHDGLLSPGNPVSYLFWFKVGFLMQGYAVVVLTYKSQNTIPMPIKSNSINSRNGTPYSPYNRSN